MFSVIFKITVKKVHWIRWTLKMKPLKTNQRILRWICACPVDPPSKWKSVLFAVFTGSIFVLNVSSTGAAAAYFLRFVSVDLEACLYCLLQIAATTSLSYMMIVVALKPQKIDNIFVRLMSVCNSCKSQNYWEIEADFITVSRRLTIDLKN